MKKLIAFMAIGLILLASFTFADVSNWKTTNQLTVAWDAVTTLDDGTAIPANYSISYRIYTALGNSSATPIPGAVTNSTQATVTFATEGKYVIGVKAIKLDSTSTEISESAISWSDDPLVVSGGTFGAVYYLAPSGPKNLNVK